MPILEISVVPVGTNDASFSDYVAHACKIIDEKHLKYQINATGTVVEGDVRELLDIAEKMHQTPFQMGAQRVITNFTLDERHDQGMDMEEQIQSVGRKMQ